MVEMKQANGHSQSQQSNKRSFNEGKRHFKRSKKQKTNSDVAEGSNEDVLIRDVQELLEKHSLNPKDEADANGKSQNALPDPFTEVDLDIEELSSTGDGLAILPDTAQVVAVPFVVPGDKIRAKIIRHDRQQPYSVADFVKVIKKSSKRDDDLIRCQYFAKCSGCQFQMMSEEDQLAHKKTIVEKAYRHFSKLPASKIPTIGDTHPSAEPYGYRTKLTPHFDGPPGGRRDRRQGNKPNWEHVPPIGFMQKGTRKTMDIEDCPIGTDAVRKGMKRERKRVAKNLDQYNRGATLLCRQNTTTIEKDNPGARLNSGIGSTQARSIKKLLKSDADKLAPDFKTEHPEDFTMEDDGFSYLIKTCITDPKAISTEYVGTHRFDNPAGAFFQNNEAILYPFLLHIKSHIRCPPPVLHPPFSSADMHPNPDNITHLVDAYCGSGLFSVFLADMFTRTIGIDTSSQSIDFASRNAELNHIPKDKCAFLAGDAGDIFAHVRGFPADNTVVVLDPSRKGCDGAFLAQLLGFAPKRVVYVSCNVHTQARDVGVLCGDGGRYEIESLMGWDFFPQTAHVEALAILRRKDGEGKGEVAGVKEEKEGGEEGMDVGKDEDGDRSIHVEEGQEAPKSPITGLEWDGNKTV
ncbi:S-adenosyl-L-methionine-dependent methyltransferase [Elsinoe ampelina]|uniref:S-adenosyl-L-methionine-dependent methyltransferase n=1 Tax=Elsinoe ampelina TaxID=302913 RepID=A0A6A6GP32_9PEZI|nr:S-adenosyl-L-methionine-dependent methyltransferase [Elsinoe ampelina]